MAMKAARYYGPGDVRIEQVPVPLPKEGQVKIKIAWNGICGSDLHAYLTPAPKFPTAAEPHVLTGETLPITLGHEFSGTIVELGRGVDTTKWKVGQNVVVEPVISCQQVHSCTQCAAGTTNLCPSMGFVGISGWGGGLSEYVAVDTLNVHKLPAEVPLEVGAMIEPLSVAYYAMKKANYKPGQSALIVGAGPIGLFILKVLRSIDPSSMILVSEPTQLRRELAAKHGATELINPLSDIPTVMNIVKKATDGLGVDVAFDAAGIQASVDFALQCVRPRGTLVNVAVWEYAPKVDMNYITFREINVTGIAAYTGVHAEVLEIVAAGKIPGIEELITKRIALEDLVQEGILSLLNEKEKQVKILVQL